MKKQIVRVALLVIVAMLLVAGCSEKSEFARGTIEGDVYSSKYSNLTFIKPANWEYVSDKELAELMDIDVNAYTKHGAVYDSKMLEHEIIYETIAMNRDTRDNIIIAYENLNTIQGGTNLTEEEYFDVFENAIKQSAGYSASFERVGDVKLGRETYKGLIIKMSVNGVYMTQYYMVKKMGSYLSSILFTEDGKTSLETVVSYFI